MIPVQEQKGGGLPSLRKQRGNSGAGTARLDTSDGLLRSAMAKHMDFTGRRGSHQRPRMCTPPSAVPYLVLTPSRVLSTTRCCAEGINSGGAVKCCGAKHFTDPPELTQRCSVSNMCCACACLSIYTVLVYMQVTTWACVCLCMNVYLLVHT